jgi:hypothetical protein
MAFRFGATFGNGGSRLTVTTAISAEESLYRCSAGFSDFLISANVLAACKANLLPGDRASAERLRVGCGAASECVQPRAAECLSPSAILFCGRAEEGVS